MRRIWFFCLSFLLAVSLCGCAPELVTQTQVLVNIREGEGFTVENNGQIMKPGEDAVFFLSVEDGLAVAGADYAGETRTALVNGKFRLTLKNVKHSAHVDLRLTDSYAAITYEPNGGSGEAVTEIYDTTNHLRTNTANGIGLFTREAYTLVSWNTRPDGTGQRIGLGSRILVPEEGVTLYAQWAQWSAPENFTWTLTEDTATITGYSGGETVVVIPASLEGKPVTAIAAGAFRDCAMTEVILPNTLETLEAGTFQNCALEELTLFDNLASFGDSAFADCPELKTLRINAVEKPYGHDYRKESCYADKVDLLRAAQGEKKIVFYGGCSTWFNLDAAQLTPLLDQGYRVINMGLNGLANSQIQMQILGAFLEPGDILVHTPELSSAQQLMTRKTMDVKNSDKLWCGLEYDYDLFALVDLRTVPGVLDGFCAYLDQKESGTDYTGSFTLDGTSYCDAYGCIPFYRAEANTMLYDEVHMDPSYITEDGMARLKVFYDQYQAKGVRIYVSHACVNMDEVPEEERGSVDAVDWQFRKAIENMDGPVVISNLEDYLYRHEDFYDTNYHLNSPAAERNTKLWLRDIQAQMERDGLWEAP